MTPSKPLRAESPNEHKGPESGEEKPECQCGWSSAGWAIHEGIPQQAGQQRSSELWTDVNTQSKRSFGLSIRPMAFIPQEDPKLRGIRALVLRSHLHGAVVPGDPWKDPHLIIVREDVELPVPASWKEAGETVGLMWLSRQPAFPSSAQA
ncbi:hypothetical protein H1C71_032526 [Ictidomys tridecemlineatus]|nr:hypothetical protein H1C71_032526 [Ictidomys tridecemlineatus]